ncbi:MAG: hypothetical protein R3257_00580 [bacterium]|nr:hypothetical protein [bacterium]
MRSGFVFSTFHHLHYGFNLQAGGCLNLMDSACLSLGGGFEWTGAPVATDSNEDPGTLGSETALGPMGLAGLKFQMKNFGLNANLGAGYSWVNGTRSRVYRSRGFPAGEIEAYSLKGLRLRGSVAGVLYPWEVLAFDLEGGIDKLFHGDSRSPGLFFQLGVSVLFP